MFSDAFLEAFSDFYGSFTLDEIAEQLGVPTVQLVSEFEILIDDNLDFVEEEMGYKEETQDED